jgi:hypothetical protein
VHTRPESAVRLQSRGSGITLLAISPHDRFHWDFLLYEGPPCLFCECIVTDPSLRRPTTYLLSSAQFDMNCQCASKCMTFTTGWEGAQAWGQTCKESVFSLEDTWSLLNFYFVHNPGLGLPKEVHCYVSQSEVVVEVHCYVSQSEVVV